MAYVMQKAGDAQFDRPFDGYGDGYKGITVTQGHYGHISPEDFHKRLAVSLDTWAKTEKRGIWLEIPITHSRLIPIAMELGFSFHHACESYLMLTKWLPTDSPNNLPTFATHNIGAAGFVVNDKHEVLLIQEKHQASGSAVWKYPEGVADLGEHLSQTASRVTFEQTGVRTEFVAVLSFRHTHDDSFGAGYMHFTCLMRALDTGVTMDTTRIAAAKWMDVDEYIAGPSTTPAYRMAAEAFRDGLSQGCFIYYQYHHNKTEVIYKIRPHETSSNNKQPETSANNQQSTKTCTVG